MPEFKNKQPIKKHINYNDNNLDHLARYIDLFLIRNKSDICDYSIQ